MRCTFLTPTSPSWILALVVAWPSLALGLAQAVAYIMTSPSHNIENTVREENGTKGPKSVLIPKMC